MTLKNYTLKVKKQEYWQEIHDLLCESSSCEHIPNREVSCVDEKEHSPTRGTFSLHGSEVEELKKHPYIDWVELCPTCNPDSYPNPVPATKRFKKDVKVYRTLVSTPATNPTISELNRTNWGIARVGITTFGEFWGTDVGNIDPKYSDFSYSLSGKNVDIIIQDSGILQYHPEFLDANGRSRVRDVILDGPYYIDPEYFDSNNLTYTKSDGRVGIATTAAESWWEDGSKRSAQFSSIGTISVSVNYTVNRSLGDSLDGTNNITSSHGTACASLAAGKNFGLSFESDIWNISAISGNTSMGVETSLDAIKIFHKYKPINVETGLKNPTVVNGSWIYVAGQFKNGVETIDYQFRGTTGTFQSNTLTVDQVTAMRNGLSLSFTDFSYRWATSSRSSSVLEAGNEMMSAGVIFIAAAGNFNQRIGIGSDDPDRLNYMTDTLSVNLGDPRFPSGTVPCNHKQWMEPLAYGFDSENDFYPVVCVGAMDDYVLLGGVERQASYSNNGPGIDVWAPADDTLAATVSGLNEYYQRYDDNSFYDRYFNGTSAAAPVTTGLIALYLQSNPKATSRDVKNWIKRRASKLLSSGLYYDQYTDDTQTTYWTGKYNLRGAESRILYNPYANDQKFELSSIEQIVTDGLVLHLDSWNRDSYSGSGTTWTDLSGNGNNAEIRYGYSYNDKSITFSTGYANVTDTSDFDFSGDFSLESWFYLTSTPDPSVPSAIIGSWKSGLTGDDKIILFITNSLQIALQMNTGANTLVYPSTVSLNQWYHIVVSRINGVVNIYLNGVVGNSLNYSSTISPVLDMRIGAYEYKSDPPLITFAGKIPVVRVYKDRGLKSSEVNQHYINQKGRFFGQSNMSIATTENIVTDNLVVHVDADNRDSYPGSGTTWTDLSGNGRNGTLNSTAIDYNKESLIFNGNGEYVNFSQYDFGSEFTLNCFIKPSDLSSIRGLFSNSSAGSTTNGIRLFINFENANTRTLHIELGNGSSGLLISTGAIITYDTWQHVAFTLNKNTSKGIIYHNGIKVKEDTLSFANYNTNAAFQFGIIGGAYYYGGALANYLLYNRVLTESEIQQNYDNQKGRFFGQSNMSLS